VPWWLPTKKAAVPDKRNGGFIIQNKNAASYNIFVGVPYARTLNKNF